MISPGEFSSLKVVLGIPWGLLDQRPAGSPMNVISPEGHEGGCLFNLHIPPTASCAFIPIPYRAIASSAPLIYGGLYDAFLAPTHHKDEQHGSHADEETSR